MVYADTIHTLLFGIENRAKNLPIDCPIEISLSLLKKLELSHEESYGVLSVLSTRLGYKCIEMKYYPEPIMGDDEFQTVDVIAQLDLLPNFADTKRTFDKYYQYRRTPKGAIKHYPNEDWPLLEQRFVINEPDIDWKRKIPAREDDWLDQVKLSVESYNQSTGSLELMPAIGISIPQRGKVKKSTGEKYFECKVMEKLFSSKTSLSNGVSFHSLLGIHKDTELSEDNLKKITNVRTAINKKLSEQTGLKKLITVKRNTAYINHLYLLKD